MAKRPSDRQRRPSDTESGDGDAFLSRWARRKRVARAGLDPDEPASESSGDPELLAKAAPQSGEHPLDEADSETPDLTDEDMPPLDAIDENTDMRGFFSPKVSEAVKKAALKKFFHSPAFNIVDGLDDYDDDFRNFAALGDIITSDMRGIMERKAQKAKEALAKDGPVAEGPPESESAVADADIAPEADESRDGRGRAKQDARAEENDESTPRASADVSHEERGVTRDPGRPTGMASGKLRPKSGDGDGDGEGEA